MDNLLGRHYSAFNVVDSAFLVDKSAGSSHRLDCFFQPIIGLGTALMCVYNCNIDSGLIHTFCTSLIPKQEQMNMSERQDQFHVKAKLTNKEQDIDPFSPFNERFTLIYT